MQEDIEHRSIAVTVQAGKLTGRVLQGALLAALRKMRSRSPSKAEPKIGANSMRRLTGKDGSANSIEVTGRIRSFERIARKHGVRYTVMKQRGIDPPKWTIYFKAGQADALTDAFKEFTRKEKAPRNRPSVLAALSKLKERVAQMARDLVKNKEHGGPEL